MATRIERIVESMKDGRRGRGGDGLGWLDVVDGGGREPNVGGTERVLSAVAGGLLGAWGLRTRGMVGWGAAALGAELVRRGATGRCMAYRALDVNTARRPAHAPETGRGGAPHPGSAITVTHAETIARPRAELYALWRDFSTLPRFMHHLERVDVITPTRSHWVARAPGGTQVEWDAEITEERENEYIAWRSVEPPRVPTRGTVHFVDAPDGRGTEVLVSMEAQPPAGRLGAVVASVFGTSPEHAVRSVLKRFKQLAEGDRIALHASSGAGTSDAPTDPWRPQGEGTGRGRPA